MSANNSMFDSSEGLFTRLGEINKIYTSINTYRGTTLPGLINTFQAMFGTTDQSIPSNLYPTLSSAQSGLDPITTYLQNIAKSILLAFYNRDVPNDSSLDSALRWLVAKMNASSDTVKACTVSSSITAGGSNNGTPAVIFTTTRPDGLKLEQVSAESIVGTVTGDSQSSGLTVGQEVTTFKGQVKQGSSLSWLWPTGSASNAVIRAIDPLNQTALGGNANWLTNGSFESWSAPNTPANWNLLVGSPGSQIYKESSTYIDGLAAIKFDGDGSTLHSINQDLSLSTQPKIDPLSIYCANLFYNQPTVSAASVLQLALVDGSNNIITDALGNNNSVTVNLSSKSALTWYALNLFIRTPRILPSSVKLRISIITTALGASENLYIDRVGFSVPTQIYAGGPYGAIFSSGTKMIINDTQTIAVSNNFGGVLQTACDRFFDMRSKGIILPSATGGAETIADTLG